MEKIKKRAGKNVERFGYQSDEVMVEVMQKSKAFVFVTEEDFGITPVETQACGTHVICLGKGGTKETVINGKTGIYFKKQTIVEAINYFERVAGENFKINYFLYLNY